MTSRERLNTALRRREPDRLPRCEQSFWPDTLARWRREGMPEDQSPAELFDLDPFLSFGLDHSLRLPEEMLEQTAEWHLKRDADGVVSKHWTDNYGPPCEVDYLVKTRADWERVRDRLAYDTARIGDGVRQAIRHANEAGQFCTISPGEPVWWALRVLGLENAMMTLALDPDFFADMMQAQAALALRMMQQLLAEGLRPDGVLFSSDLCYRNGMLFSPAAYRTHMMHFHREMADLLHAHGMLLILHCDGDVREFIPLLIEAGFDCIEPLEARCGNDVRELKPRYGDRISFFGNISMDVLATGDRAAIRHEVVSKIEAAKVGGGYIHQSDHSVPPTVSWDDYRYWMELAREYGGY
ncbi:MAG: uroporphyrinogen decarboxylase family protein [Armatimonadetes bacterium]|nr:uroporphyrinogen decarboxylase family protein [Armatimonadota bacterium]